MVMTNKQNNNQGNKMEAQKGAPTGVWTSFRGQDGNGTWTDFYRKIPFQQQQANEPDQQASKPDHFYMRGRDVNIDQDALNQAALDDLQ